MQAIDNGIPASIITESLFARYISALKEERVHAENILTGPDNVQQKLDKNEWIDYIRQALYMGKVCAYAQGSLNIK